MDIFYREETRKTPEISLDPKSGKFDIKGRSFSKDTFDFYEDLFKWLNEYIQVPLSSTIFTINSDYFNTASYKCFVRIIKNLENIADKNHTVKVMWLYEKDDEEIKEAGEDLKEITSVPLQILEIGSDTKENQKATGGSAKPG